MVQKFETSFALFVFLITIRWCSSECENGCRGHGRCTVFDMCVCHRNWMGNDCSQRMLPSIALIFTSYFSVGVCEFGLSFVDTPKGDLDSSDTVDSSDEIVAVNSAVYPYGTSEQYPLMEDSDFNKLNNSAHYYSECSDAGICNRQTGVCECFDGFGGAACQRLLCPGEELECSGHGVCQNLRQLAKQDFGSSYELWDRRINRGCLCDKGFYGGDCSLRRCDYGIDPMYFDDVITVQYPTFFIAILSSSGEYDFSNGANGLGYYSIKVFDYHGHAWYTEGIQQSASCDQIISALEGIPQNIIPKGSVMCERSSFALRDPLDSVNSAFSLSYKSLYHFYMTGDKTYTVDSRPAFQDAGYSVSYVANSTTDTLLCGDVYLLQFYGNPGTFQQPEINVYVNDGTRPTIVSDGGQLLTKSWTNGQQGMSSDYFADHCKGVKLGVTSYNGQYFLYGSFIPATFNRCIYQADFSTDNDVIQNDVTSIYDWDHGTAFNPHIIRLVRTVTDVRDGGFFVVFYFDTSVLDFNVQSGVGGTVDFGIGGAYRLLHPFHSLDDKINVLYDVYTTQGVLRLVGNASEADFDFASNQIYTTNITRDTLGLSYDGELSCEAAGVPVDAGPIAKKDCLDKGDLFLLLDPYNTLYNPPFINIYKAVSIRSIEDADLFDVATYFPNVVKYRGNQTAHFHKHVITTDLNTNWAQDAISGRATFHVYKFTPSANSTFEMVSECSNRGICNTFEGICDCFPGYSGGACQNQDSLAT